MQETVTVITRPRKVAVNIDRKALQDLPTATWVTGRSGSPKALSRYELKPGALINVTDPRSNAKTLKQVIGTPEMSYDDFTKQIGYFANVRDPSLSAIRAGLPKDAWRPQAP